MSILVTRFDNHPVPSSCYIVKDLASEQLLIVDPGTEDMSAILSKFSGSLIDRIVLTHEHFDHCWGCNYLHDKFNTPIVCSENCAGAIPFKNKNLSIFYDQVGFDVRNNVIPIQTYKVSMDWHGHKTTFWQTEGHSPGGICFLIGDYLFTGDTLLEEKRTVTKLLNGSKGKLMKSIHLIGSLTGNGYFVCPGHGDMFGLDSYDLNKAF